MEEHVTMPDLAAEAVLIAAGGRAILLQLADPAIGYGVAHHSDFRSRPLDRLHGTLTFAYAVAFGTEEDIQAVTRRVNRAHVPVQHPGDDSSPAYNAFDPQLQLWVAATLYDSAVTAYERVFGPMEPLVADRLYEEYGRLGDVLQMPATLWPADRAAFAHYWNERIACLATDDVTRAVAHQLLHPSTGPLLLRAAMPLARLVTAGFLPHEVRHLFDLPWTAADQRRFDRVMRVTSFLYPRLPGRLRHWPKNRYLRVLRRSIEASAVVAASPPADPPADSVGVS
jgi:uncharacterized protein (DUF2236 family)